MGFESSVINSKANSSCNANISYAHLADKPTNMSYLGKVTVGTNDSTSVTGTALKNVSDSTNLGAQIQGKVNGDFSSSLLVNYSVSNRLDLGAMGTLGSSVENSGLKLSRQFRTDLGVCARYKVTNNAAIFGYAGSTTVSDFSRGITNPMTRDCFGIGVSMGS